MKRILFVAAVLALLLSACGPQATPTIDPAQVQASAIAAANTMVAMTQAAIPTATPIPPTPVPSPTLEPSPTPIPLPTLAAQPSPTLAVSGNTGGPDTCNHLLDAKSAGHSTNLNLRNKTNGQVTVTIGLGAKNAFGQCGYLSWQVGKMDSITVSVPQTSGGVCYWAYAWINDPQKPSTASGSGYCFNTAATWHLDINYDSFVLTPP